MDVAQLVEQAESRIRPHIRQTILEPSPYYSKLSGATVHLKCENLQHTGSLKVRGATNKLLLLTDAERARGVVAASTGNHGMGVAHALNRLGAKGLVFVPENAARAKIQAIRRMGTEVRTRGGDTVEAEASARQYADQHRMTYISPYNDPQVVAGQGTVAVELARQLEGIDAVFVPLGGGGLAAGIAGFLSSVQPAAQVIGCSPENSQVMIQSVRAGKILERPSLPTLSDATAGGVEKGSITFGLCRKLVNSYRTVSEDEIASSLRQFIEAHHMLIEGAAAVAIAAFLADRERFAGKQVVIVLSGANIGLDTLKQVLQVS